MKGNPLRLEGSALSAPALLSARLLALYLLAGSLGRTPDPFLPFLSIFDALGPPELVHGTSQALMALFAIGVLLGLAPRACCFGLGALVLGGVLSSRLLFSNSSVLFACAFLLLSVQEGSSRRWMLRAQLVLVYLGAGLDKLLDPDWRDGRFFEYWTREVLALDWYAALANLAPERALSTAMGWGTLGLELALAVAFSVPRWTRIAVSLGLSFHVAMLLFTAGALSWSFLFLMAALSLSLAEWTAAPVTVTLPRVARPLLRCLRATDVDRRFAFLEGSAAGGLCALVLQHPISFAALTGLYGVARSWS